MGEVKQPARVVPPGRILKRELEARGWTQKDLAEILGRPQQAISEIVGGEKQITPETAIQFGQAFDTSPEFWMNLETNYQLFLSRQKVNPSDIQRKSRLYSLAPVPQLIKRGWIRSSSSLEELEAEVCRFLRISSVEETPSLTFSRRHSQDRGPQLSAQVAWARRVEQLAQEQAVSEFKLETFEKAIPRLVALTGRAEDVAQVPHILMDLGVHFVIVPPLPQTYIDGAAFYIEDHPVVALTLRYDRIDAFWFTLMHEIAHIVLGHAESLDTNLYGSEELERTDIGQEEIEANTFAQNWLVDRDLLNAFVRTRKPYFSQSDVVHFANSLSRHPGIVLGQLHKVRAVGYQHLRRLLVKVTPHLQQWIDVSSPQAV
ncbi:MAG TPA: HigA family addiction module antitoxin [Chloroflexia bacterium]|jgi:HTH-type transcriptional regulator/antitoxin HigA